MIQEKENFQPNLLNIEQIYKLEIENSCFAIMLINTQRLLLNILHQ